MLEDGKRSEVPLNLTIEQRTEQLRKEDEIHLDLLVKTKNEKLKVRRVVPVMCEQLVCVSVRLCVCVSVRLCVSVSLCTRTRAIRNLAVVGFVTFARGLRAP